MTPLSFLILTDHRGHSVQNSLYALATALAADPRAGRVDVASRGDDRNADYFAGRGGPLYGLSVGAGFTYEAAATAFPEAALRCDPADYDVVWLRLPPGAEAPPPLPSGRLLIVNDPAGSHLTGDKTYLLNFPAFTPPCRLVTTAAEVSALPYPAVLKPLRDYGGRGIVRLTPGRATVDGTTQPVETFLRDFRGPYLAMRFLRNVSEGDKRIIVVNGRILAASLRLPPPGGWLCNVARGGRSVAAEIRPEEREMVAAIAPQLLEHGVCFAGFDTLADDDGRRVLSELNTTSIGGFPQAQAQTGEPILQRTIDEFFNYCHDRR